MAATKLDRFPVELTFGGGDLVFAASSSQTLFHGFLLVDLEGRDEHGDDDGRERALPTMALGYVHRRRRQFSLSFLAGRQARTARAPGA